MVGKGCPALRRRKVSVSSARWDDLMHGKHAHGLMAAGVACAAVLDDLRRAVQSAIDDGEGFDAFPKGKQWALERTHRGCVRTVQTGRRRHPRQDLDQASDLRSSTGWWLQDTGVA